MFRIHPKEENIPKRFELGNTGRGKGVSEKLELHGRPTTSKAKLDIPQVNRKRESKRRSEGLDGRRENFIDT